MRIRQIAALTAFGLLLIAMALGTGAPASAQGYYHGPYRGAFHSGPRRAFYGGPRRAFYGGYRRPFYGAGYGGRPFAGGWRPGPGYTHHSWAWYQNHPAYWRAAHPYHGTPSLGIWLRL